MPPIVTSRQNAHVRALRAALRDHGPHDVAAVEGWTLLQEALCAEATGSNGLRVRQVFLREDRQHLAAQLPAGMDVLVLSADAFASAAATEQTQGVASLLQKPVSAYVPAQNDVVVVAAGLQDPGNLGTLIRSAEALGASALITAEQAADPWNGKAVRASAGSVFRLPLLRWSAELREKMRAAGIRVLAAVPSGLHAIPATAVNLCGGCAFLIGNEGNGLSPAMLALCDERITLPMPGPTESLNAAVAGSLLLYEASRQRRAGG